MAFSHLIALGALALIVGLWLAGIWHLAERRRWAWAIALFMIGAALPTYLMAYCFHPFGPKDRLRVLDRTEAADHTQLILTQSRNQDWREPWTVLLWIKPAGKSWHVVMLDFEDLWWRKGKIQVSGARVEILREGEKIYGCELLKDGALRRAEDGITVKPVWMQNGWEPRDGGEFQTEWREAWGRYYAQERSSKEQGGTAEK